MACGVRSLERVKAKKMRLQKTISKKLPLALLSVVFVAAIFTIPKSGIAQVPALYGSTSAFQWMQMAALGNTVSLGIGQISSINSGNFAISSGAGADLQTITRAKLPIGNANLAVDVVAKIPAASVAKAVANFAVKVAFPLQVGVAVYDLLKELNYTKLPDGTLAQEAPGSCSVAPCAPMYGFSSVYVGSYLTGNSKTITIPFAYSTQMGACNALAVAAYGIWPIKEGYPYAIDLGAYCRVRYHDSLGGSDYQAELATPSPSPPKYNPVTRQDLENTIAAKSGWPSTSAIARAVKDAVNSGEPVDAVPQTVTGPASTPGTTTSSTTSGSPAVAPTTATSTSPGTAGSPAVDSITTTKTTTNNYTYNGPNITVANSTVTQITNNTTGQTQTATTTTAPEVKNADLAPKPEKVIVCGLPDTPACKLDETGTKPDAGDTYTKSKTDLDNAKTTATTAIADAANIATPAWSFTFQLPTGCAPYVTGIKGVILNVCQYQPVMHSLLSAIWAAATVFCMIGMVGRTIRES